jgi:hypothetical protein
MRLATRQTLGGKRRVRYAYGMTKTEQGLLDTLLELERTIEAMPRTTPKPSLLPLFSQLDELTRSLPPGADPLLLHYLHKKSYQKARLFLQGREADNARGNCHGHVDEEGRAWSPGQKGAASISLAKKGGETPPAR